MREAPNVRQPGKKHGKQSTSSASSGASQFTAPVIAPTAPGRTRNHRDDMSSGLSGGHKAAKIRRALAKFNLLTLSTNRYCIALICTYFTT